MVTFFFYKSVDLSKFKKYYYKYNLNNLKMTYERNSEDKTMFHFPVGLPFLWDSSSVIVLCSNNIFSVGTLTI